MTDTTHRAWFAPTDEYTRAQRCPTCKANSGEPCRATSVEFHSARVSAGIAHYNSDVGRAPWSEDRTPGVCYSTITNSATPVATDRKEMKNERI